VCIYFCRQRECRAVNQLLKCSDCGVHVTLKNLTRHRRIVHAVAQMNNDNAASDSTDSAYIGSGSSSPSCSGKYNVDDALVKAALEIAATSLLDQHHIHTEPELVKFLEENFQYVTPVSELVSSHFLSTRCTVLCTTVYIVGL